MEAVRLLVEGRADLNVPNKVGESRMDSETRPADKLAAFCTLSESSQSGSPK
jgi:hypothetical protein